MVFRKPYAFLIKNFKKIHILLLVLWAFIYYKIYEIREFIKEFVSFGTYNENLEGITTKVTPLLFIAIVSIIIITVLVVSLLIYKKKPWKLYLVILAEYIILMSGCVSLIRFFDDYTTLTVVSEVYIYRDIINIANLLQYAVLIILIIRVTGVDLKKFSFHNDKEFLELTSEDREEFEVSIEIDKHSFIRTYNKIKRNLSYFYKEHRKICNVVLVILIVSFVGYTYYFVGVKHKSYKQGNDFVVGNYSIKINNSYSTNKDMTGKVIEKDNKFVIISVTMKNNGSSRVKPNFNRFHLMNKTVNKTNTIYYDDSFVDVGEGLAKNEYINAGESRTFNLIYKVSDTLKDKRFVLYYQEYQGYNETYLRKIKLKVKDISKIEDTDNFKLGSKINFEFISGEERALTLENYVFNTQDIYYKYGCETNGSNCYVRKRDLNVQDGYKILKISFSSSDFTGKEFVDFSYRYGRIKYEDSKGKTKYYDMIDLIDTEYEGKEIFLKVPDELAKAKGISLEYTIRTKKYVVKLK